MDRTPLPCLRRGGLWPLPTPPLAGYEEARSTARVIAENDTVRRHHPRVPTSTGCLGVSRVKRGAGPERSGNRDGFALVRR